MRLTAISLSTRITLLLLLLLMAGGLLWVSNQNSRLREDFLAERSSDLEVVLHVEQERLLQSIETLRQDAVFLANTPPISGIVRAKTNNGFDPRDNNPYEKWEKRLQEIFAAFLRAHPDYFKATYIGVEDYGRELVRVDNINGKITVTSRRELQTRADRDYFREGLSLKAGEVYLSEFNLNQEHGKIEVPHRPTLRAVTPVLDATGRVFGMVVLNIDATSVFAASSAGVPPGVQSYITDQQGHYLYHPDAKRAFGFELGDGRRLADDFPLLAPLFESENQLTFQNERQQSAQDRFAAARVFFVAGEPDRYLVLAYRLPAEVIAMQASGIKVADVFDGFLILIIMGLATAWILHRSFAPLRRITAAAHKIAAGDMNLRLTEKSSGEIGELASALNTMLDKLSHHEVIESLLRRNDALMRNSMEGIHVMDIDGNVLEVNDAFCNMLGYTREEALQLNVKDWDNLLSSDELHDRFRYLIGRNLIFETVHRRKDGSLLEVEICTNGVEVDGKGYLYAASRDISARKQAELVQRRHKQVLETAMDGFWLTDLQGHLEDVNEAYAKLSGYTVQELLGMHISQLEAIERPEETRAHIEKIMAEGHDRFETRHRRKDGAVVDIEVAVTLMRDEGKLFVFCRDISARKRAEQEMRIAAAAFETHDAILITDADVNIVRVNHAFTEITGYSAQEVIGKNPRIMSSGRQDKVFYQEMWEHIVRHDSWAGEIWDRRKNGEIYPKWMTITAVRDERGEIAQYVAIFSDITARKRAEEEIRNLAFYDALTQLPNRRLFHDRFHSALQASARYNDYGAVLFIDLDRFKMLNDTLGHDYGDLLLVEVAARLKSCVREIDTVARLGGDEFVVLLENVSGEREEASHKVGLVAEKIRETLAHPYSLKEHEHYSSPSIGISLFHGNDESMDELLKRADAAMYQAKNAGRNAARFYDPSLQHDLETRATLENDLRRAIENKELHLYYQVQVDGEHRPVGVEALLRWIHPQRGLVSPGKFIPIAEDSSLILEIGNWVLETACAQLATWAKEERMRHLTLAINVSAHQFRAHEFVEHITETIRRHGVEPSHLKLELTESVVLNDLAEVAEKMAALKRLGVQLSLDDFGTGYSSLSYLKRLPLDQLKIDQSFIRDITSDQSDAGMVQTIIDMAKNFDQDVIAEGVETEAQLTFLKHNDCMAYQGYFFSKPVPVEELKAMMDKLP